MQNYPKQESKISTLFRLIRYLLEDKSYTLTELSKKLNASERTIRRYLEEDLANLMFPIIKNPKTKTYSLPPLQSLPLNLSYGFSLEESLLLKDILLGIEDSPLKNSVLEKVFQESELKNIAEVFLKITNSEIIKKLTTAIKEEKQVVFKNYYSIQSQTTKDRVVEPLQFVHKFTQIRCYEPEKRQALSYNIGRIEKIEILDTRRTFKGDLSPIDPFGLTDNEEIYIELELSKKAYLLMQEEFPPAEVYLKQEDGKYFYKGFVRSFKGVSRFVLGLPEDIKVHYPEELKAFLRVQIAKFEL